MRLGFWQKTAIYFTTAMVGLSGLLWFILHDVVDDDPGNLAHLLLTLHGISSYALLVVIGSLLPLHVRSGWQRRHNLVTGLTVTGTMAALSVTALMLYYGSEEMQQPAKWLHLSVGFGALVLFPIHALLGTRNREPARRAAVSQGAAGLKTESS